MIKLSFFLSIIFSLLNTAIPAGDNRCDLNSDSSGQLMELSGFSLKISEVYDGRDPLVKKISGEENDFIKVEVSDEILIGKKVELDILLRDETFLKKAFGKQVDLDKRGDKSYHATRSVLGVEIEFDLDLTEASKRSISIDANDYSMVFRNSLIKLNLIEMGEMSKITIYGVAYIKK